MMADSEGLEPSTERLTAVCSTNWATNPWMHNIYEYVGKQAIHLAFYANVAQSTFWKIVKKKNNDINVITKEKW